MKIGIDCRTILNPDGGERAGVGHYTQNLVTSLLKNDRANEYVLFFDEDFANAKSYTRKNVEIAVFPRPRKRIPFWSSHFAPARFIGKRKLDVFHGPANVIPLCYAGKSVVTVHDLAIYKHPEWFPDGQDFSRKVVVPRSLRKAQRMIAVSKATKQDIMKLFWLPDENIVVVPEGVNVRKVPVTGGSKRESLKNFQKRMKLGDRYVLFVSTLEPRKNLERLIEAFDIVHASGKRFKDLQLVLAGARGWKYQPVLKKIIHAKAGSHIRYLDYVSHNDKIELLKNAELFVFPSLDEGFGLPVLEAMAVGVPVVTSNAGSLPELVGRSAVQVNPKQPKDIAAAMKRVLGNRKLQRELSRKGTRRAAKFTWDEAARDTLAVYDEVVHGTKSKPKKKISRAKK